MPDGLNPQQRQAVRDLVERGVLSQDQADAVLTDLDVGRTQKAPWSSGFSEVLGYVGGALVLGGAALLLNMSWDDLSRAMRAGLLVAATLVLAVAGVAIAGGPRGVRTLAAAAPGARSRIVAVLFALGSGTAAMAMSSGFEHDDSVAATVVGLLVALIGYLALPSVPGLLATGGFSVGVVLSVTGEWMDSSTTAGTIGLIALGLLWAVLAGTDVLAQRQVGLGGGAAIALVGAQWPLGSENPVWGYTATLLLAVLCFAVFVVERAAVLLAAGVVGVTVAVPEAVWDWTGGALGGPLIVLLVGVVLLVAGGLGLRLHKSTSDTD